jgi:prevent-host-death family protein
MPKRYSIAEARHNLAAIIHELEQAAPIELTRRGEPVAVLLSTDIYRRLLAPTAGFWAAYLGFRASLATEDLADLAEPFADLRDRSPGREVSL